MKAKTEKEERTMKRIAAKLVIGMSVFVLAGSLFAAEPFAGTWKGNVAKSKFGGPDKPPKEITMVIQEQGDHVVVTQKGTELNGSPISVKFTVARTGGEAAKFLEGGPPAGISVVYAKKTADARILDTTTMRDGKVIQTSRNVLSADGKTMTMTNKGTDAQGKPFESVMVADRQ
jgi:hypothetical protein